MSGHSRWKTSKLDHPPDESMVSYVRGYILALEDVLDDMDMFAGIEAGPPGYWQAKENIKESVTESLRQANQTLEAVLKLMESRSQNA